MSTIDRFLIDIPPVAVTDLQERLRRVRWPEQLPGVGWERGVPVDYLRDLAAYWAGAFDWPQQQGKLNAYPQFTTRIDGLDLHFVHAPSPEADSLPLLLLHGWPGTFADFLEMVGPLTDPRSHGLDPTGAFDVVIPSIPGHGFTRLSDAGWTHTRCAAAYVELMARLGYQRYGVQGGDHGSFQAPLVGRLDPSRVVGVHVNALLTFPSGDPAELDGLTDVEADRLSRLQQFQAEQLGYVHVQGNPAPDPGLRADRLTGRPAGLGHREVQGMD
jgi:epoxide hydrolase